MRNITSFSKAHRDNGNKMKFTTDLKKKRTSRVLSDFLLGQQSTFKCWISS